MRPEGPRREPSSLTLREADSGQRRGVGGVRARASRFEPRLSGSMEASRLALAAITSAGFGDEAGAGEAAVGWAGEVGTEGGVASELRSRIIAVYTSWLAFQRCTLAILPTSCRRRFSAFARLMGRAHASRRASRSAFCIEPRFTVS